MGFNSGFKVLMTIIVFWNMATWWLVCMYVCMYVCVYIYIYIYIYIYNAQTLCRTALTPSAGYCKKLWNQENQTSEFKYGGETSVCVCVYTVPIHMTFYSRSLEYSSTVLWGFHIPQNLLRFLSSGKRLWIIKYIYRNTRREMVRYYRGHERQ